MKKGGAERAPQPWSGSLMRALAAVEHCERLGEVTPWARQVDDPFPFTLPDMSEAGAWRRSSHAQETRRMLAAIDRSALPNELRDTLALADHVAERHVHEGAWYWTVFDPTRTGLFTLFAPTPFGGAYMLNMGVGALESYRFEQAGDADRYAGLIADLARVVNQLAARTTGQAQRGIFMPKAQLDQSRSIMAQLAERIPHRLQVARERLVQVDDVAATARISRGIEADLAPSLARFAALLDDRALDDGAPDGVGLSQYPSGGEIYAALVKGYSTLPATPESVHTTGLERMARITSQIETLLNEVGFAGRFDDFRNQAAAAPAWRVHDAAGLVGRFESYARRAEPMLSANFAQLPDAGCTFEPLPEALTDSITFGFYSAPSKERPQGVFRFNTRNLAASPLLTMGSLTYHEVVPGHHLQIARQHENRDVPRFRRSAFVTAYAEGWAEYAAALAGEAGLYVEPEERLGRLMMDAMLTCRLVVDTGMNALGWSLERGRHFMRAHSFMTESEVASESLRYSCDLPGQALVYKLGDQAIMAMREEARTALGARFDIKGFHEAVLVPGSLPLPVVHENVRIWTSAQASSP
jgi:uncharacterized protein (DUF885 family)